MYQMSAMTITVFLSLFLFAQAGFTKQQIKEVADKCNAVQEDMDVVLKYEVPSTATGKCLMSCILKLLKTISPDTGLYDKALAFESLKVNWPDVDVNVLQQLANKCQEEITPFESLAKSDTCEYGYKVAVCVNKSFKNDSSSQTVLDKEKNASLRN